MITVKCRKLFFITLESILSNHFFNHVTKVSAPTFLRENLFRPIYINIRDVIDSTYST